MEAKIVSFRRGIKTQAKRQMIVKVSGVTTRDKARTLLNKNVVWKSPGGKEIKGIITTVHGNSGALRVQFERGLPGQSLNTKLEVA
jgi:large subunit ribosomal protein L35Ae